VTSVYLIYAVTPRCRDNAVTAAACHGTQNSVKVTVLIVHLIAVVWLGDNLSALGSVLAVFAMDGTVFLL